MGMLKNLMMEQESQGYYNITNKSVCYKCFGNRSMQAYILKNAQTKSCDYCKKSYKRSACTDINLVISKINQSLDNYYIDPNNLLWSSDEESWNDVLDAYDMFKSDEAELECNNEDLIEDLMQAFEGRQWFREGIFYPTESAALKMSWEYFESIIKERWRYTFFFEKSNQSEPSTYNVKKTFEAICKILKSKKFVKEIPAGTVFYRVRKHNSTEIVSKASQIGTPKPEYVKTPNRLSPINIPLFYGSIIAKTAIEESKDDESSDCISIGEFVNNNIIKIIDLSKTQKVPGFYSKNNIFIEPYLFINDFSRLISKPIQDKDNEYLEYLPTQVFTEYIRHVAFKEKIRGIFYKSSRLHDNINVALFYQNDECKDDHDIDPLDDCLILKKVTTLKAE